MINKQSYLVPFILVTSLFFFWGFAHSILDVLNKHFQDALVISKSRSALVQAVVYGGYFLMALPAGSIIKKWGYRTGVVTGLILYGIGALLFIPGERIMSFEFFLLSLFIIGCGLTCLETAANPYITVLGDKDSGPQRLNLAQSFNGLGWICGPLVGGLLIFTGKSGNDGSVALPYAIIGIVVLIVAIVFSRIKLPEIVIKDEENIKGGLWEHAGFVFGVVALFFYVAAQTGINSFFINYVTENIPAFNPRTAALILSFGGMGLFMIGRMGGSWIMKYIKAEKILMICAIGASTCMMVVTFIPGKFALVALLLCYLFESIMFPTIFALAIRGLDSANTKRASSFLIMSIVGGAIAPVLMGAMGEKNMAIGFVIPMICFIIILIYTFWLRKQTMRSAVY
ncbi:MAG TPA: L-fucose:H+ symporter permease [Paludibacter sp.]|nr:L-fucose:H+ symporter permease [Paludibacter sp.]